MSWNEYISEHGLNVNCTPYARLHTYIYCIATKDRRLKKQQSNDSVWSLAYFCPPTDEHVRTLAEDAKSHEQWSKQNLVLRHTVRRESACTATGEG